MEQKTVALLLVGLGGYGGFYLRALLENPADTAWRIAGGVDPRPEGCARLEALRARGVPIFASTDEFFRSGATADLAVLSTPIHLHAPQACDLLGRGLHVLCEKPVAATVQDAQAMAEARDRTGRGLAIGYQWSFNPAVRALKRDILAGRLGRPLRLSTLVLWPRDAAYYARGAWAGALDDGRGHWILDSPVNNAASHYLHNMFYVLGPAPDRSARPSRVTAELYRANPITNYDTACIHAVTEGGVEVRFVTSHAVDAPRGPEFVYEFEHATVRYAGDGGVTAAFRDGTRHVYGDPHATPERKLWDTLAAVRGGAPVPCGPEAAMMQTLCMNGAQESAPVREFPRELLEVTGEAPKRLTSMRGLSALLERCWQERRMPSELGAPWAAAGREVDLAGYTRFPSRGGVGGA